VTIARRLLAKGANPNAQTLFGWNTAAHMAVRAVCVL
jgi:hypothetical protein